MKAGVVKEEADRRLNRAIISVGALKIKLIAVARKLLNISVVSIVVTAKAAARQPD